MKKLLALVVSSVILVGCSSWMGEEELATNTLDTEVKMNVDLPRKSLNLATKEGIVEINIEVADDDEQRKIGLMNRESLPEDEGMLFIYDRETNVNFWMKNTLIPLDMIFMNADKEVVNIVHHAKPCQEEICPLYNSVYDAMYILEVNSGFANEHDIKVGTQADW